MKIVLKATFLISKNFCLEIRWKTRVWLMQFLIRSSLKSSSYTDKMFDWELIERLEFYCSNFCLKLVEKLEFEWRNFWFGVGWKASLIEEFLLYFLIFFYFNWRNAQVWLGFFFWFFEYPDQSFDWKARIWQLIFLIKLECDWQNFWLSIYLVEELEFDW